MIEFKNISFGYGRGRQLFDGLSLRLGDGHVYGLLGCNGAGKSTLLRLMCGVLHADGGAVDVDGFDPSKRPAELLRDMMVVPEEFSLPDTTLDAYVRATAPFYPAFSAGDFDRCCRELAVDAAARFGSMSMGQRKKAFLAFALACNARTLLLDEPTNGLDIPSKAALRRILAGYASDERTVVVSTHQVRDVENLLDGVVILDHRGVALCATADEITSALRFGPVTAADEPLYSESSLMGTVGVSALRPGEVSDGRMSIELLFNAVTADGARVRSLFNTKNDDDNV